MGYRSNQGQAGGELERIDLVHSVGSAGEVEAVRPKLMTGEDGRPVEVKDEVAHDEPESERDDRQVVAAKTQGRHAHQEGERKRHGDHHEQRRPDRVVLVELVAGDQRVRVGADPEKGDESQV